MTGPTFRESMNWLHTWAGVVIGALLFAIFWMGSLSVFDREIDRWMMPMTRVPLPAEPARLDTMMASIGKLIEGTNTPRWFAVMPVDRATVIQVYYRDKSGNSQRRHIDPAAGAVLPDQGTMGGTSFIFPFHFGLHLRAYDIGEWLVGLAGMTMLALCVSGVVIHKRIFADFFLLRIGKTQRTSLDLHNVAGVLGLPFHFIITLSGLIIFINTYWPSTFAISYGAEKRLFNQEAYGNFSRPAAKIDANSPPVSLDLLAAKAVEIWNGGQPGVVSLFNPGDASSYVSMSRSNEDRVTKASDPVYFDLATGAVLSQHKSSSIIATERFISGMHFIQFRHWTLRWIYFVLGLAGCVIIATGFLFWLESRRKRHARLGLAGVRVVEGLTIGSVSGIIIATAAFLVVNRILPLGIAGRASVEFWTFYAVWVLTFAHAWYRPNKQAWAEQCLAIATLFISAVSLNAATTGDHLLRSLTHAYLWGVAGVDILLLIGAGVAIMVARRLGATPMYVEATPGVAREGTPHA